MANIYSKVPVKVQKKSGFDKSFKNLFTSKVGTITPILTDELMPNTTVNLRVAMTTQMPPLASDTFMNVKQKYAAFFVPTRLLMQGYEAWLCGDKTGNDSDDFLRTPTYTISTVNCKPGTLADYLGIKVLNPNPSTGSTFKVSALPFLAYHRIYDDWFRNSLIQKPVFNSGNSPQSTYGVYNAWMSKQVAPFNENGYNISNINIASTSPWNDRESDYFFDGVRLFELRQANFGYDLFTSCSPQAQNGDAQKVTFDTSAAEGSFTISALRAANSLQQFLERNNLAGNRLVDYVKAQYGANLSDAIAQRPILIGSGSFDVYSKGIYQTTSNSDQSVANQNPFQTTATRFGNAYVEGNDLLIKGFTSAEPGYLMVVTWLSPKVTYSSGIDPMLTRYIDANAQSDLANPILQNVGNEPIRICQLDSSAYEIIDSPSEVPVFGYNERYANWKDKCDELHGLMRDGSTLQSFALQRGFLAGTELSISSDFLQIPTTYLDQVSAVSSTISQYGYWTDCYFDYKVSMPLARYSIPSLQDPAYEHGESVVVDKSGKQIN